MEVVQSRRPLVLTFSCSWYSDISGPVQDVSLIISARFYSCLVFKYPKYSDTKGHLSLIVSVHFYCIHRLPRLPAAGSPMRTQPGKWPTHTSLAGVHGGGTCLKLLHSPCLSLRRAVRRWSATGLTALCTNKPRSAVLGLACKGVQVFDDAMQCRVVGVVLVHTFPSPVDRRPVVVVRTPQRG